MFIVGVVLVIGGIGAVLYTGAFGGSNQLYDEPITIYKSPTCGCCDVYASYMEKKGYVVSVEDVVDMEAVKRRIGVPEDLESCHTTEIGGYVVEGHIPQEAIAKLLAEKPDIHGIGMSGMPSGSPGMPGPKTEDFVIYEITREGSRGDIFMTI